MWCRRRIGENFTEEVVGNVLNELLVSDLILEIRSGDQNSDK